MIVTITLMENQDQDNDSDESDLSNRLPDSLACLSSLSSVNTQSTLEFISSKLTIFKSEEFLRCTDIFLSDSDLLPILLFNSIPVLEMLENQEYIQFPLV